MSQEDVEIVRRGYEALNRGELRPESFGPDFEIVEPREQPGAETRHGGKGVRDSMAAISEAFDDFQFEPERFIEAGDKVVALLTARGRGKGSGIVVERKVAHVWTLHERKPARVEIYLDVAPALKAVGLSEQDAHEGMSQENVETLRAFLETWDIRGTLEAWNRGEADLSLLDPEITYEDTILPDHVGETYRGYEGVARATKRWLEPYEELKIELEQIVGEGDRLVSIHRARTRARHTGIEFEGPLAYFWTFRKGRVIHLRSYLDPADALKAAGLSE